jgi:hypothetical protein
MQSMHGELWWGVTKFTFPTVRSKSNSSIVWSESSDLVDRVSSKLWNSGANAVGLANCHKRTLRCWAKVKYFTTRNYILLYTIGNPNQGNVCIIVVASPTVSTLIPHPGLILFSLFQFKSKAFRSRLLEIDSWLEERKERKKKRKRVMALNKSLQSGLKLFAASEAAFYKSGKFPLLIRYPYFFNLEFSGVVRFNLQFFLYFEAQDLETSTDLLCGL